MFLSFSQADPYCLASCSHDGTAMAGREWKLTLLKRLLFFENLSSFCVYIIAMAGTHIYIYIYTCIYIYMYIQDSYMIHIWLYTLYISLHTLVYIYICLRCTYLACIWIFTYIYIWIRKCIYLYTSLQCWNQAFETSCFPVKEATHPDFLAHPTD